jgi:DNA-binding response OmpR family regulator
VRTPPLKGCTILLVEDDYLQARAATAALERAGARVIGPAGSAANAFALIAADKPDAAVLDINLGTGPSFEIADRLQSEGIPFLFLTGYDEVSIPDRFEDVPRGEKPLREGRLVELVGRLCD